MDLSPKTRNLIIVRNSFQMETPDHCKSSWLKLSGGLVLAKCHVSGPLAWFEH